MLLLDEPAAGLSPEETRKMVSLVRTLKGRYTIVLIEHKMDIIMSVSDRISVMHFGALIAEGSPAEIQAHPRSAPRLPGGGGRLMLELENVDAYYGIGPHPPWTFFQRGRG